MAHGDLSRVVSAIRLVGTCSLRYGGHQIVSFWAVSSPLSRNLQLTAAASRTFQAQQVVGAADTEDPRPSGLGVAAEQGAESCPSPAIEVIRTGRTG